MLLIADFGLAEALLTVLAAFFVVVWVWIVIAILRDLFADSRLPSNARAAWTAFLVLIPLVSALVYLIVRGDEMRARTALRELTNLDDLRTKGAIDDDEFERLKGRLIGGREPEPAEGPD